MEDKFTFVKAELKTRHSDWAKIATKSGISRRTINYMMKGSHSPTMTTIDKLYKYLKKTEGK